MNGIFYFVKNIIDVAIIIENISNEQISCTFEHYTIFHSTYNLLVAIFTCTYSLKRRETLCAQVFSHLNTWKFGIMKELTFNYIFSLERTVPSCQDMQHASLPMLPFAKICRLTLVIQYHCNVH